MPKKLDPMDDDNYTGNDDQIQDLKDLVSDLRDAVCPNCGTKVSEHKPCGSFAQAAAVQGKYADVAVEHTREISLTDAEIEALGEALDLAHGDQEHWMKYGDPKADYGSEWPETRARKAALFRALATAGEKLGFHGELERWNSLAEEVEEVE